MHKTGLLLFAITLGIGCTEDKADELLTNNWQELEYLPTGTMVNMQMRARTRTKTEQVPASILGATYSTPFGFAGDDNGLKVAVDSAGNAYVTGTTSACGAATTSYVAKFNTSGFNVYFLCLQAGTGGSDIAVDGTGNAYVVGGINLSKIDPTGSTLIYSVNFSGLTALASVAIDSAGNAYVAGYGMLTGKAIEAQVAKINAAGTALFFWVSFGGTQDDKALGIAVDGSNNVLVTGITSSTNFPVFNAFQPTLRGLQDAFVTKLSAAGNQILYSTYLGGDNFDYGFAIAADAAGNAWVGGTTTSFNGVTSFPVTSGAAQFSSGGNFDGFVAKFNTAGGRVYATYVGGSSNDEIYGIAVDASTGSAYVSGYTASRDYPIRGSAFQTTFGGAIDGMVTQINAAGSSFVYSTYLGGASSDNGVGIALDASKNVYATGSTFSSNFPSNVYPYAGGSDGYITKFLGP